MTHACRRTDKEQHFSEKVTKVESILAASESAAQKKQVVSPPVAATEKKVDTTDSLSAPAAQKPSSPATNQGTWASMFKK